MGALLLKEKALTKRALCRYSEYALPSARAGR